jgi:hypothetical protein
MKRIAKVSALAAVLSMILAGWAHAADQTILGRSFIVKNPAAADKRKVTGAAKEVDSPNTIVGDPTLPGSAGGAILGSAGGAILGSAGGALLGSAGGAVLTVIANGDHPSQQIFPLKQGKSSTGKPFWRASGTNGSVNGFKYKDPNGDQGAVKVVLIKKNTAGVFSIKAVIRGKNGTINVVPPNLGTDGFITLFLAHGDRYCVAYVGGTAVNDGDRLFKVRRPTVEACPGSPSAAFVDGPDDLSD